LAAYYRHILRAVQRIVVPRSLRLKLVPFMGLSRRCLRLDLPWRYYARRQHVKRPIRRTRPQTLAQGNAALEESTSTLVLYNLVRTCARSSAPRVSLLRLPIRRQFGLCRDNTELNRSGRICPRAQFQQCFAPIRNPQNGPFPSGFCCPRMAGICKRCWADHIDIAHARTKMHI
jgi:hypothetical protein